jgi:hypothetical protein
MKVRLLVISDLATYFLNKSIFLDTIYVYLRQIEEFRN